MAAHPERSPARLLAPLALVACAVATVAIVLNSRSDDGSAGSSPPAAQTRTASTQERGRQRPRRTTYTVKTGDTLAGIAEKTGVTVARLQELNPELDPQALVSGQKIKLRE
jgi:LysM repeat protein